jgi:hypothetical protein
MNVSIYPYVHTLSLFAYIYMDICIHVVVTVCFYMYVCICLYIYMDIYIYIWIYDSFLFLKEQLKGIIIIYM